MGKRLQLQALLETLLGSNHVYVQAKTNMNLEYPCIIYERDYMYNSFADNQTYHSMDRYLLTSITSDPDSDLPGKIINLPMCKFNKHFVVDNNYHDVFNLYF